MIIYLQWKCLPHTHTHTELGSSCHQGTEAGAAPLTLNNRNWPRRSLKCLFKLLHPNWLRLLDCCVKSWALPENESLDLWLWTHSGYHQDQSNNTVPGFLFRVYGGCFSAELHPDLWERLRSTRWQINEHFNMMESCEAVREALFTPPRVHVETNQPSALRKRKTLRDENQMNQDRRHQKMDHGSHLMCFGFHIRKSNMFLKRLESWQTVFELSVILSHCRSFYNTIFNHPETESCQKPAASTQGSWSQVQRSTVRESPPLLHLILTFALWHGQLTFPLDDLPGD